jgi:hypothetical protein
MPNTPTNIWPGSGSFAPGDTPFGIYDADAIFAADAPSVARWCAIRLGYPIQNVELLPENFYAFFEEATSEYSAQVNQWNIRNNLDILKGHPTNVNMSGKNVQGSFTQNLIAISEAYGTLAGVGGNTDIKRGFVTLEAGRQNYDLNEFSVEHESGSRIDVTRVFYQELPAIGRFFDPYASSGMGTMNMMQEFGFGAMSPSTQFVLMPLYEDLLRMQAIEFNDQIRKSAFTFNIVNNKLQIFPVPKKTAKLFFEYMVRDEFIQQSTNVSTGANQISDYSNIKYDFIPYSVINDVGRQWIRKYTLALSKESLGAIREKYSTIPIPGSEISLDGSALRSEAQTEKEMLITQLRENLEDLSRKNQFEQKAQEAQYTQDMLGKIPLPIFIG